MKNAIVVQLVLGCLYCFYVTAGAPAETDGIVCPVLSSSLCAPLCAVLLYLYYVFHSRYRSLSLSPRSLGCSFPFFFNLDCPVHDGILGIRTAVHSSSLR